MSEFIKVQCPACRATSSADRKYSGKTTKCSCGHVFVVSELELSPPESTAASSPVLKQPEVHTGFFKTNDVYIDGTCPHCGKRMEIHQSEMSSGYDSCPKCKKQFAIDPKALEEAAAVASSLGTEIVSGAVIEELRKLQEVRQQLKYEAVQFEERYRQYHDAERQRRRDEESAKRRDEA
jgi:ssDNA-binding Zn-finger/Zn-ribbon topoisomerase 1